MNIPIPEKKTTVHYKGRQRSILGKVSFGVGLSALFFLVFLIFYGRNHELAGVGGLAFVNGLLAVAGGMTAVMARRETPFLDGYTFAGLLLNVGIAVVTFALLLVGTAL